MQAAMNGHLRVVQFLVEQGSNINIQAEVLQHTTLSGMTVAEAKTWTVHVFKSMVVVVVVTTTATTIDLICSRSNDTLPVAKTWTTNKFKMYCKAKYIETNSQITIHHSFHQESQSA